MKTLLILLTSCVLYGQGGRPQALTLADTDAPLTPTDSPGGGTYGSTQSVTLADATAALILYTTNGTTPACPGTGTLYTGAISVTVTTTIKAIGCNGITGGGVLTSVYTITGGGTVAFDARLTGGNGSGGNSQQVNGSTLTATGMTLGGTATCLIAILSLHSTPAASSLSMTWNGVSMTAGPVATNVTEVIALFVLPSPATGNHNLVGNWTTGADAYMSAVSFSGTNTSTCINATDNNTATTGTSLAVTSGSTGATIAAFMVGSGSTPTLNFNSVFSNSALNQGAGASYQTGGTSNTHTFTGAGGSNPALAGVHVIP